MKRMKLLAGMVTMILLCIGVLCGCEQNVGTLYSIQEAYEKGWITQDNIMEVCYYRFGEVWFGENLDSDSWVKYEYAPKHTRQELDKSVENDIKKTYYAINKSDFFDKEGNSLGGIDNLSVQSFGTYNDSCVVIMKCTLWDVGQVAIPMLLAGVAWWETGEGFLVYRVN